MGAFHTACKLLSIIVKYFGDAGLCDLVLEAGVIAEGSVSSTLEGRQYSCGVMLHKIVYESFLGLVRKGFYSWLEGHHAGELLNIHEVVVYAETVSKSPNNKSFLAILEMTLVKECSSCLWTSR